MIILQFHYKKRLIRSHLTEDTINMDSLQSYCIDDYKYDVESYVMYSVEDNIQIHVQLKDKTPYGNKSKKAKRVYKVTEALLRASDNKWLQIHLDNAIVKEDYKLAILIKKVSDERGIILH